MTLICDLHPFCQSQGCTSDPANCKRVRDLCGGVEKRPDRMPRHDVAIYKLSLRGFTDDQLFEEWSRQYDAKQAEYIALIIAEMNTRNLNGEVIHL